MIMTEWYRDDYLEVRERNRQNEEADRYKAKQNAELMEMINGKKVKAWVHVGNPVVGKCRCCGKVGIIDDVELGLF